jgi:hypothetical protein
VSPFYCSWQLSSSCNFFDSGNTNDHHTAGTVCCSARMSEPSAVPVGVWYDTVARSPRGHRAGARLSFGMLCVVASTHRRSRCYSWIWFTVDACDRRSASGADTPLHKRHSDSLKSLRTKQVFSQHPTKQDAQTRPLARLVLTSPWARSDHGSSRTLRGKALVLESAQVDRRLSISELSNRY